MSDLELTKACADAMGYKVALRSTHNGAQYWEHTVNSQPYEPLTDGAEEMALVKRFRLAIDGGYCGGALLEHEKTWRVEHNDGEQATVSESQNLNRAIVECVAKMQQAKP